MIYSNPHDFLVSIVCITYNQSAYINDALGGFVMQQTKFPFVAVVIDDASTDGEQEIIEAFVNDNFDYSEQTGFKQWDTEDAHWTFCRHKNNENCHFVFVSLKQNLFRDPNKKKRVVKDWMNSKYIALCEGDDYWTDPYKLQKQVDYMESHDDCVLVYHNAIVKNNEKNTLFLGLENESHDVVLTELLQKWAIPTASVMYRKNALVYPEHFPRFVNEDYAMELLLCNRGVIHYLPAVMSVYRRHSQSVSAWLNANEIEMYDNIIKLLSYMRNLYGENDWPLFDAAIERYIIKEDKIKQDQKYPFLKYLNWRFYKRMVFKILRITRVS